jgi:hypothetical protein
LLSCYFKGMFNLDILVLCKKILVRSQEIVPGGRHLEIKNVWPS